MNGWKKANVHFRQIVQGIASEDAVSDEFLNSENSVDEKSRREWIDSKDGGKRYEERGIEMGENGYRCRWLLTGKYYCALGRKSRVLYEPRVLLSRPSNRIDS